MYLEYPQFMLLKFDTDRSLKENNLIRYFRKDLKPLIKAQIEQKRRELDIWQKVIEKTVEIKSKTTLQLTSFTREIDYQYQRKSRLVHTNTIKMQTPENSMQDPRNKKTKRKV